MKTVIKKCLNPILKVCFFFGGGVILPLLYITLSLEIKLIYHANLNIVNYQLGIWNFCLCHMEYHAFWVFFTFNYSLLQDSQLISLLSSAINFIIKFILQYNVASSAYINMSNIVLVSDR